MLSLLSFKWNSSLKKNVQVLAPAKVETAVGRFGAGQGEARILSGSELARSLPFLPLPPAHPYRVPQPRPKTAKNPGVGFSTDRTLGESLCFRLEE